MTADSAQREPTMEEILASIRRIISEEDVPSSKGADVLELSPADEPVEEAYEEAEFEEVVAAAPPPPAPKGPPPREAPVDDLMVLDNEPEHEPQQTFSPPPAVFSPPRFANGASDESLVADPAARQAAGALGRLMGSMRVSSGATLDDVVRDLLRPMLKEWLDAHLPQIVESEVAREIERIRRMARS
jgi:uncharacterized protein